MEKSEIKNIVLDQNEKIQYEEKLIEREVEKKILEFRDSNLIIILTGLRRSGKSTILNMIKKKSKNINIYVNFDDFRLVKFNLDDFQKLNEIFLETSNLNEFFFDEIQNIEFWERYIRTMHDRKNKLYITGSNATMLSTELGTHLTGRNIVVEVYPFSFKEFLIFKDYKLNKEDFFLTSKKVELLKLFDEYLKVGGIAEYLKTKKEDYLKFIYEDIINRDVVSRYGITNVKSLKDLIYYLISNIGKEFSYNKLTEIIDVKNSTTVKEYIEYFENSYLIFTLNKFDYSLKKQLVNPKKVYTIDTGLANAISFKFSENRGRLLENVVFIELKRRRKIIYYHKEKKECDFVIKEGLNIVEAMQVCQGIGDKENWAKGGDKTREREIEGLIEACKLYNLKEGLILTENEEYEIEENNIKIYVKPIWKWLLES